MNDCSDALERQVARIYELLERSPEAVTWDDHIPDPDNPEQLRQIDVTIRRDDKLILVECRLSRKPQNVKWIEELIGRRQSLGAEAIIAVASAGFTKGAKLKAARHGVVLRDLCELTDDDIASWGRRVCLTLYYCQYSDICFAVGFPSGSAAKVDPVSVVQELRSHEIVQSLFNAVAEQLDTLKLLAANDTRTHAFRIKVGPEGVRLSGEPVLEIEIRGKGKLASRPISAARTLRYGSPEEPARMRGVTVEQFTLGETIIVHEEEKISMEIDLTDAQLPALSQVRFIRSSSDEELDYETFSLLNPCALKVSGNINVVLYSCDFNKPSRDGGARWHG
jgi:Restriction endonuclease